MIAIIGGTGFYTLDYMDDPQKINVRTPFGGTTFYQGKFQGEDICFLPRHGFDHNQLANQVNYRANIWGLHESGVDRILGTSAVAAMNLDFSVGDLVALDQLIDFSRHRRDTFNLGSVNFTDPYCFELRETILKQAGLLEIDIHPTATYVAFEGPRYETAAEIRLWKNLGMDVLGMTNGTEAALARELGICYAVIGIVTNMGAGLAEEQPNLATHKKVMQDNVEKLKSLTLSALANIPEDHSCECQNLGLKPAH